MATEYDTWRRLAEWQEKHSPPLRYITAMSELVRFIEDSTLIDIEFMGTQVGVFKGTHAWNLEIVRNGCVTTFPAVSITITMDGSRMSIRLETYPPHNMSIPTENPEEYIARLRHFEAVVKERLDTIAQDRLVEEITENYLDNENLQNPRR
jgi:hypothetical protein